MKLFRFSKKQVIIRLIIIAVLLTGSYIFLLLRSCTPWRGHLPLPDGAAGTQETMIAPPEGFARIPAEEGSFLAFMRAFPVYPQGSSIMRYDGTQLSSVNAAAVYVLSVTDEDLQQCADTVIRLWAEYFRAAGQADRIAFQYSNGLETRYTDWVNGWRYPAFYKYAFRIKLKGHDDSEQAFYDYLHSVMKYAGTLSLEAESQPISASEAHAGDIICKGGAPGHVVVIVDEAVNEAGERCFLIAQGFTPAQSAHIIAGYGNAETAWYTEEQLSRDEISLSSYNFSSGDLRRWKTGF